ncbi:MAG: SDR family oxidoreductase [Emcibacter sp.]|nr:SDR family oxidoreductase [Emcibacter sp.]
MSNRNRIHEGKVALVTGGAQGLGFAVAQKLSERGARVFISDINQEHGENAARKLKCEYLHHNISLDTDWVRIIDYIKDRAGGLNILINNAGIEGDTKLPKNPEQALTSDWEAIFDVNAKGTFIGCRTAIPVMAESGGGAIINFSSVASLVPTPFITAYGASKAAVDHFSKSVAVHCGQAGYHIRCNSVHPGQVRTPMLTAGFQRLSEEAGIPLEEFEKVFISQSIPLGVFQEPEDIAYAVSFLVSDEARYITGQSIAIDGGFALVN